MQGSPQRPTGLWASATRLLHTLIQLVETRVELFALELKEQRLKLVEVLVLTSVSVFLGGLSLVMVTITVIFATWENPQARLIALLLMTLFYIAGTVAAGIRLNHVLRHAEAPFAETLGQLKKDRAALEQS
jgi:uncharacterized membrane protein YqjE